MGRPNIHSYTCIEVYMLCTSCAISFSELFCYTENDEILSKARHINFNLPDNTSFKLIRSLTLKLKHDRYLKQLTLVLWIIR